MKITVREPKDVVLDTACVDLQRPKVWAQDQWLVRIELDAHEEFMTEFSNATEYRCRYFDMGHVPMGEEPDNAVIHLTPMAFDASHRVTLLGEPCSGLPTLLVVQDEMGHFEAVLRFTYSYVDMEQPPVALCAIEEGLTKKRIAMLIPVGAILPIEMYTLYRRAQGESTAYLDHTTLVMNEDGGVI